MIKACLKSDSYVALTAKMIGIYLIGIGVLYSLVTIIQMVYPMKECQTVFWI